MQGGRRLCENDAANAVLSSKAEAMGRSGLTADFSVSLPKDLPLAEVDLCALLGNALDNAMEACMELPPERRLIRIYMEMKGNFLYLALTNTAGGAKRSVSIPPEARAGAWGFKGWMPS